MSTDAGKTTLEPSSGQLPLPPHPTLRRYYRQDQDREGFVSGMFDAGAPKSEWICWVMSLGSGAWYRRRALNETGLVSGMRVLDVATGTGLVLRAADELSSVRNHVIGLDPSEGMLEQCRKLCQLPLVRGRGEHLPFPDGHFDLVSMGYGLRHVGDLHQLFEEFRRVLKPSGRVMLLELSQPPSRVGRWFSRAFLGVTVPALARLTKGAAAGQMMDYFWDTIEHCVSPDVILSALRDAGFVGAARTVEGGVLSVYRGTASPRTRQARE